MTEPSEQKGGFTPLQALGLVWDVLFSIAIPTAACALIGRWLDTRYGTSPLYVALGLLLALVLAAIIILRKGKDIAKRL